MSETTAPLLATRDALAKALCEVRENDEHAPFYATQPCRYCLGLADALLASGVVRDPAILADDEELVERVAAGVMQVRDASPRVPNDADSYDVADAALRALAAALTEDPS